LALTNMEAARLVFRAATMEQCPGDVQTQVT
jgi:hypothetical protein